MRKIPIDILVHLVDNFGDIGFALELVVSLESHFPGEFQFRIFTNEVGRTNDFFSRNQHLFPKSAILDIHTFLDSGPELLILALFHAPIPALYDKKKRLILRIDYLSFDSDWIQMNGKEHIQSGETTRIAECIPSPLSGGSGLIRHDFPLFSRETWLQSLSFPIQLAQKKWISIFCYPETFARIDFDACPDDTICFCLGVDPENTPSSKCIVLPFLAIDQYYLLQKLSDFNIIRGEVSFVQALFSQKPFLWDMYKMQGGWNEEQSEQFLDFFSFSSSYREYHRYVNTDTEKISLNILDTCVHDFPLESMKKTSDFTQSVKNYIDSFLFSL